MITNLHEAKTQERLMLLVLVLLMQIGGMRDGGYVNARPYDNPTIEYFPTKGPQVGLNILAETLPCNL